VRLTPELKVPHPRLAPRSGRRVGFLVVQRQPCWRRATSPPRPRHRARLCVRSCLPPAHPATVPRPPKVSRSMFRCSGSSHRAEWKGVAARISLLAKGVRVGRGGGHGPHSASGIHSSVFPLVPKVSAALWERMRGGETPFRWQAGEHGGQLSRSACADGRRSLAGIYVPKALR
jgi:hypothetical protein